MTANVMQMLVDPLLEKPIVDTEDPGAWIVRTQNSTYEISRDSVGAWSVRRVKGLVDPTHRTGLDGVWKDAENVTGYGDGMLIVWSGVEATFTSAVRSVVAVAR
jgi:hypothetical protein